MLSVGLFRRSMHLIFVSEYGIKVKMHATAFEKL